MRGESRRKAPASALSWENSVKEAHRLHTTDVGTEHLLLSIIRDVDCVAARILITLNINLQKIFQDIMAAAGIDAREYQDEIQEGQKGAGSMVEQYCTDLTAQAEAGRLDPVLGREEEMYRLMQILSRRTKNTSVPGRGAGRGKDRGRRGAGPEACLGSRPGKDER